MKTEETPQPDYNQPVAYDAQGNPLYAHPPKAPKVPKAPSAIAKPAVQQVVHVTRSVDPVSPVISPEVQKKHERSRRQYPFLNLSEGEYIIRAVRRHPIGLFAPLALGAFLLAIAFTILSNYASIAEQLNFTGQLADTASVTVPILLFAVVVGLGMFVSYYVYVNNKFFLTNESVIQEIQLTLFSHHEQTVSLASIEDASYVQAGIIQQLFNYGSIRLSTEGDETTYRFTFVANPKRHIAVLNNAVEAFKNGRPINDD